MFSPVIAEQLRQRGHDVVAVKEREDLIEQSDRFIFSVASLEKRAIVTENVPHFRSLNLLATSEGNEHSGLVYTTNRSFPRGDRGSMGKLVSALEAL
jgi:hypothetical protein